MFGRKYFFKFINIVSEGLIEGFNEGQILVFWYIVVGRTI